MQTYQKTFVSASRQSYLVNLCIIYTTILPLAVWPVCWLAKRVVDFSKPGGVAIGMLREFEWQLSHEMIALLQVETVFEKIMVVEDTLKTMAVVRTNIEWTFEMV